jgi:hypothetical protein
MSDLILTDKISAAGMSYPEYYKMTQDELSAANPYILSPEEKEKYEAKKLNIHRMWRIDNHYEPVGDLINEIGSIELKQLWMVITENWCGDSAQNLPYIAKIASLNKNIELKIILRDSNPHIMDKYLTNDTKSIPILVSFDAEGNELFKWGARPKAAQQLVNDLKAQGLEKKLFIEKLHLWYAKNKGADVESEILALIKNSNLIKNAV